MNRNLVLAAAVVVSALSSQASVQPTGLNVAQLPPPVWLAGAISGAVAALGIVWWWRGAPGRTPQVAAAGNPILGRWPGALVERFSRHPFPFSTVGAAKAPVVPENLTWEMVQELEEREFVQLVGQLFGALGFRTELRAAASGDRTDLYLYRGDQARALGVVQCLWPRLEASEKTVQALETVMAAEQLPEGYVVTRGTFSASARSCEKGSRILLMDGRQFQTRFNFIAKNTRAALLTELLAAREARKHAEALSE